MQREHLLRCLGSGANRFAPLGRLLRLRSWPTPRTAPWLSTISRSRATHQATCVRARLLADPELPLTPILTVTLCNACPDPNSGRTVILI